MEEASNTPNFKSTKGLHNMMESEMKNEFGTYVQDNVEIRNLKKVSKSSMMLPRKEYVQDAIFE